MGIVHGQPRWGQEEKALHQELQDFARMMTRRDIITDVTRTLPEISSSDLESAEAIH